MRNVIFLILFIFTSLGLNTQGWSSTFVGNGGNSGDVELEVSKKQILNTFQEISKYKNNPDLTLCECNSQYKGSRVCDILESLTSPQKNYCADFLKKQSDQVINLIQNKKIHFIWTRENIDVVEFNRERAADAVTNPQNASITLNLKQFIEMNAYERSFLLTHEILHLTNWEKKYISDDEKIGPFTSADGGKQLLNSAAAAGVMAISEMGLFEKFNKSLNRSKSFKNHWVSLDYGQINYIGNTETNYNLKKWNEYQISYRHQWDPLGLSVYYKSMSNELIYRETIHGRENQSALGLKVHLKKNVGTDPLTFLGQSYLLLGLGVESLTSSYKLSEEEPNLPTVEQSDHAASTSLTADCSYFMPLESNFWIQLNVGYVAHKYRYSELNFSYGKPQMNYQIGASYAF